MYRVLRNAVPDITPSEVRSARKFVLRNARTIFNPDSKRVQASISHRASIVRKMKRALGGALYGRVASGAVVLHSFKGCEQQPWHTDYDPKLLKGRRRKPLGAVLALQAGTGFMVRRLDGTPLRLELSKGDLLLFEGDLVHAGARFSRPNTRIHMYVDVPTVPAVRDETWFAE